MEGFDDSQNIDLNNKKTSRQFLSSRDIYMRVAQNLELIDLYYKVNRKVLDQNPNQNELFVRTT
jgi:hypothetical protein